MTGIQIRKLEPVDYEFVKDIYLQGIKTKNATFETSAPSWEDWNKNHLEICRFAACLNNEVVGWAALSPFSSRYAYRGVSEVSIYVSTMHSGKGIGTKLLNALVTSSEKSGIWTLYSSIFPENKASIKLHKSFGFREIGYHEKIACMDGAWRNTVLFERRSKNI
jgi:L-amino acid N-acyltransferase YncA